MSLYDIVLGEGFLGICIMYNDVMKHELACSLNEKWNIADLLYPFL